MAAAKQAVSSTVYFVQFDGLSIDVGRESFEVNRGVVDSDTTGMTDGLESSTRIRDTCEPSMTVIVDESTNGAAIDAKLVHGATGLLIWGPKGNAAGKPKYGIWARVDRQDMASKGDRLAFDIVFKNEGNDWEFDYDTNSDMF